VTDERGTSGGSSDEEPPTVWGAVGQHAGYGLTIAASLGFFMAVGWWADGRLGTLPWLTVLGALVGAGGGFYSMYRDLVIEPRNRARRDDGEGA
jgi:hypothetical protein